MKKAYLVMACALLAPMLLVSVSSSATYDPWVDLDESGDVDIFDVVTLAGSYQTTGDPTKNVNVTNWPVSDQTTVFFNLDHTATSEYGGPFRYSQMHVLWRVSGLEGAESVTIRLGGRIWDEAHTVGLSFLDHEIVVTETKSPDGSTTINVPSQDAILFSVTLAAGTTASVCLAFYLFV